MTFNPNNPTASGMVLTFDDEFNTLSESANGAANGTTWTNHIWWQQPGSQSPDSAFSVANGALDITANTSDNPILTSVNAAGQGFAQKFGYFEADIKMPPGAGTWAGFWMINNDRIVNPSAGIPATELDIIETQGTIKNGYYGTLHQNSAGQDAQNGNNFETTGNLGVNDITAGYHRYGVLWDPNSPNITFYFDGQAVGTAPKYADTDLYTMMLNLQNGYGNMNGSNNQDGTTQSPDHMMVDYVRVYQFAGQNPTAVQVQAVSPAPGVTDPTALATALGVSGGGASSSGSSGSSGSSTSPAEPVTTGPDTLKLHVSGDQYNGDPLVQVFVDGRQVGGNYDVYANHSAGQFQDLTISGTFDPTKPHQVVLQFQNDAWDGTSWWSTGVSPEGHDRDVYVGSITLDGQTLTGSQAASNTATNGLAPADAHGAVMDVPGMLAFNVPANPSAATGGANGSGSSTPPVQPVTAGPDTLTLHVSGDQYNGDPLVQVLVDGKQVGGNYDISANHSAGQFQDLTLNGTFDPTKPHQVVLQFQNDAWDGTAWWGTGVSPEGHDRDVYVGSITLDGQTLTGSQAASNTATNGLAPADANGAVMDVPGMLTFNVPGVPAAPASSSGGTSGSGSSTPPAEPVTTGPDTLTLHVSGDQYKGDPLVQVFVDGKQVGGNYDISANHSAGQFQDVTINGTFDPTKPHQVVLQFQNDAWDGTSWWSTGVSPEGHDRDVYVGSITLDGQTLTGSQAAGNTATNGLAPADAHGAVMDVPGMLTFNLPAAPAAPMSSSGSSGTSTPATSLAPSFTDGAGHEVFLFSAMPQTPQQIANFDPTQDILDLAPVLKAAGYTGSNPIADHVVTLAQSGVDSTAVMVDPTGASPTHGGTLVTLAHVLPQSVPAADIWH